jgi:signal transduction histidine kinase
MGPNGASTGARGRVSANNWSFRTETGSTGVTLVAGRSAGQATGVGFQADALPARTSLLLLVLGCAILLFPIVFQATAFRAPTARTGLETMMTMFAFAAAWLFRGQFSSSRRLSDLLLFGAALTMGLMALCIGALPAALGLEQSRHFAAAVLWGTLFLGVMFAAAAFARSDHVIVRARYPVSVIAAVSVAGVLAAVLGGLFVNAWLVGGSSQSADGTVEVLGHPLGLALVLSATVLLAFAATGFARQFRHSRGGLTGLLALAALLLASASFYHLVPVSLKPGWIGAGPALAAVAFILIVAAALRKDLLLRDRITNAAALAERRRVARDLHDGLAQDLALIAVHGELIAQDVGDDHPMVIAARRALTLSRSTIAELSDPPGASPNEALEAVAQEFRDRLGVEVSVQAECGRELAPEAQEHVSRIAREAIANAARHGGAKRVAVSLRGADSGLRLRVVDDGCGIADGDTAATEGFGLRSMRERTAALGGHLTLRQLRKRGTELEVLLP